MVNRLNEPRLKQESNFPQTGIGAGGRRTLHRSDILAGAREVIIEHRDECYRLRLTSMGKLILTR
ncbi:MAG: hemin uptake protein HemP [Alphaproteobacteria bacterium]|nr:hemin uptake protein HemP [Alphaproteobacteria bacterium]